MVKSEQRYNAPMPKQIEFWNDWNPCRESMIGPVSKEQSGVVSTWLQQLNRTDLDIIDIGCGAGWMCEELIRFGHVTGNDLADQVLERAALRVPSVKFIAGDFMALNFDPNSYDVAISLEVLPHVANQSAFLSKISDILRHDGYLMLATQNRTALEKNNIQPPAEGQIRHWVNRHELLTLLSERFEVIDMFSITPHFNSGWRRYLNSNKLRSFLAALGLRSINRFIKDRQEKDWLGWTLMALARNRAVS